MQDHERLINHFFKYCNVTITAPYVEKNKPNAESEYSVSYILKEHPVPGHNLDLINFSFRETKYSIFCIVDYCISPEGLKYGLSIDGDLLKNETSLVIKCVAFLKSMKIMHYCPIMNISFQMNKKTKEISFLESSLFVNSVDFYSQTKLDLKKDIDRMVTHELASFHTDTANISLSDKLDLLAMARI